MRHVLLSLVTAAVLAALTPAVGAAAAPGEPALLAAPAGGELRLGGTVNAPGVTPRATDPGPARTTADTPLLTLRETDPVAAERARRPDGKGGGYACTPYVDWDMGDVEEDNHLEETVTVDYYGEVECNFYLYSIEGYTGAFDRSDSFNGEDFDGDVISSGSYMYTEWDYFASSFGGFGVAARGYNGAREVEPAIELALWAPEGLIWDECQPLPGLRYLACDGLGTDYLYVMVGPDAQSTGLTKACRDQTAAVDPEQGRVPRIYGTMPASTQLLRLIPNIKNLVTDFKQDLCGLTGGGAAGSFATQRGQQLWDTAVTEARNGARQGDDRQLYWARLSMTRALSQWRPTFGADSATLQRNLDRASRGMNSHGFGIGSGGKAFVSGFDPFSLDDGGGALIRSNPSAAAVLRLDGTTVGGAEVQAVIFPVRYAEFDARLVEDVFGPHLAPGSQQATLITTVSQGSDENAFDLEFYNGRRRASYASGVPALPDNVYSVGGGGTYDNPVLPNVDGGAEFVATSLPVDRMLAISPHGVNINTEVDEKPPGSSVSRRRVDGHTLGATAVQGGGGGYLSNEIAYRVTRLRDALGVNVPAGHVHTPYLDPPATLPDGGYDNARSAIGTQYRRILEAGVVAPAVPPVRLTVDRDTFRVGESPVYTVLGGPNAEIRWTSSHNGVFTAEVDADRGQDTDGNRNWSGSYHQWNAADVGQWTKWVRVGGRLAQVSMTVQPAPDLPPVVTSDFDGDNRVDLAVWRPSDGTWYVSPSSTGGYYGAPFGLSGDLPVDGDFDGDGRNDLAVYRPSDGTWYLQQSGTGFRAVPWGLADDLPAAGDFDGDGRVDVTVFRPADGTWHVVPSGGAAPYSLQLGALGDRPAVADYDGDDRADHAVFRPSTGTWLVRWSGTGQVVSTQLGLFKDDIVPADYDGDGRADLAVFRGLTGTWYVLQSSTGTQRSLRLGTRLDTPVPGDYDGDNLADFAVVNSSGSWRIVHNTGSTRQESFGLSGDLPIPGRR